MKYVPVICCLLLPFCGIAQSAVLSNDWKSYPIPTHQDSLRAYNRDRHNWAVFVKAAQVYAMDYFEKKDDTLPFIIKPSRAEAHKFYGNRTVLSVEDGFLIGFDHGEWGGYLYWFSKDGKNRYEIAKYQVNQFIKRQDTIFAIEGVAHLGESRGNLITIEKKEQQWQAISYHQLPYAPCGIDLDNEGNFIIVTSNNLIKIDKNNKLTTLIESGFWSWSLYPNSLAIHQNIAYIGMRKGILKYNLSTTQQEWLLRE